METGVIGLISLGVAALIGVAQADTISATNSDALSVDGINVNTPALGGPLHRDVVFTGLESGFGTGVITDVNLSITFTKAHIEVDQNGNPINPLFWNPHFEEIGFTLVSPSGLQVKLVQMRDLIHSLDATFLGPPLPNPFNGAGSDFSGTMIFDEGAAALGPGPAVGTFQPIGSLAAFTGQNAKVGSAPWKLLIEDAFGGHPLVFTSFTLTIETAPNPPPIPEPASLVTGFAALLALCGVALRRCPKPSL